MNVSNQLELYVSTEGKDSWSGRLPTPGKDGSDGPFATITKARDTIRKLRASGKLAGTATVFIRGGAYHLDEPVTFTSADSGPTTYAAYSGEQPIIDGGRRIGNWRVETRNGIKVWITHLPEVVQGSYYFRQLFVNGQRRARPRWPKEGSFWMEEVPGTPFNADLFAGSHTFRCKEGDIQPWEHLTQAEVVSQHFWTEERLPISSFDPESRLVRSSHRSVFALVDTSRKRYARYYLENLKEALSCPGEWFLDRTTGELTYLPIPGETPEITQVYAPRLEQLLVINGDPADARHVEGLSFVGLTFRNTEWNLRSGLKQRWRELAEAEGDDFGASPQAASHLPGVISLRAARNCAIEDCIVEHVGFYGIELAGGCRKNRLVDNTLRDLGAGGIKIEGAGICDKAAPYHLRTGENEITDNHISAGGRVFFSGVGIACLDTFANNICHNHIHDLFYTGISCGWYWDYKECVAWDNLIEKNHIHHIGQGVLSDMGGVYTLGVQPGTVIRGNLIHDVEHADGGYGGWGIYLDQGSSHIVVENNVIYNVSSHAFDLHYGRENILRNNVWAFGREGQLHLSKQDGHNSITLQRNLIVTDGQPVIVGKTGLQFGKPILTSDLNIFWDISNKPLFFGVIAKQGSLDPRYGIQAWQELGYDRHSVVADPLCRDVQAFDFTFGADSPAAAIGMEPIDVSDVGPRPSDCRAPKSINTQGLDIQSSE